MWIKNDAQKISKTQGENLSVNYVLFLLISHKLSCRR